LHVTRYQLKICMVAGGPFVPMDSARHRDDEFMWRQVRVADAKLDALIARGYLAADEREDAEAVQAALETFLADRLSGGHLH
jgi:hypothetical protein